MTKTERAAAACEYCAAGNSTYWWQNEFTHRVYKKIDEKTTRFDQFVCRADLIWKEFDNE